MSYILCFYSCTGCPKKHVIPNFKSQNIIKSARVYFMKSVKDSKDVSIMSMQDEQ